MQDQDEPFDPIARREHIHRLSRSPFGRAFAITPQTLTSVFRQLEALDGSETPADLDLCAAYLAERYFDWPAPLLVRPRDAWVGMFRRVGYVIDGYRLDFLRTHAADPRLRPENLREPTAGPVRLYRSALYEYRAGISWTPSLGYAHRHHNRKGAPLGARIWAIEAQPDWLLGENWQPMSGGLEVALDIPAAIEPEDVSPTHWPRSLPGSGS